MTGKQEEAECLNCHRMGKVAGESNLFEEPIKVVRCGFCFSQSVSVDGGLHWFMRATVNRSDDGNGD